MNKQKILFPAIIMLIGLVIDSCIKDDINTPPGTVTLTAPLKAESNVAPGDSLVWQEAIDIDGDLLTYDVYLGTEAIPEAVVSTRQVGTSYIPELIPGTSYYWKIVAQDGAEGTSESEVWSFSTLNTNNPPAAFNLLSPVNGATDHLYIDFLLEWETATDPEGDTVTYDVILDTDTNPTTVISSDQTGTTYGPTLSNGTTYYWKVVAKDGKGGTRESEVWSFTTINYPPGEINLLAPDDGEPDVALDAILTWETPSDQDGDPLTYDVYLGTSANPSTIVSSGQTNTNYAPVLTENTTYYWKIVAHDGKGGMGYSPEWSFTTIPPNNPPGAFSLNFPANEATGLPDNDILLKWDASTDPDGDAVTYDVYLGTSSNPTTVVSTGQSGLNFYPTLVLGTTYYWKVVAKDAKGGSTESEIWSFTTRSPNQAPAAFSLLSPAHKDINVEIGTDLTWEAAIDPDFDVVIYDVYIGTSSIDLKVVSKGQAGTSFSPTLLKGYTYFWRVVAKDGNGGTRESETWSFTTVPAL